MRNSMIMKRRLVTALLTLLIVPVVSQTAFAQALTAEQVVEKHLAALGGREALTKITTRKATGVMVISTPMGDLSGPLEMTAKAPNKMRADIKVDLSAMGAGEMVMVQLFDGATGWSLNSMQGDTPLAGDQLESQKNNFFPTPLLKYKELGQTIALQPREKINGKDTYVILVTPKAGPPMRMCFDPDTFLMVRSVSPINTPQLGPTEQISEPSDYRAVDGVKVPFFIAQSAGGQNITLKFTKIEHNVPIADALFVKK